MIVTAHPSSRLATFCRCRTERAVTMAMMASDTPTVGTARNRNSARTVAWFPNRPASASSTPGMKMIQP